MAVIKNIIQTQFTSTGSGAVNKQVETLNKNQTRLAQSSASAGRSFAAQSQGLGGLVGAYAGAAATTFALQQAFSKLAAAARAEQTLTGLKNLATASGESSSILLKNVREITNNQLTLAEAAQQINLSLSAGFDQKQIEGLASVAIKASRALGRDLTDAYTRVIRGSAKLETELLDELGIYTKIGPSTRAYAAALGRTAESLTEFERRQAFVNSVIAEGNRKFSAINTTIPTTAEKLEAFGVKIIDVATSLGMLLANYLAPIADFLTNNFAGSLAAIGTLFALVSKTAVTGLGDAIGKLETKIQSFTDNTTGWLAKNGGDWQGYSKQAQEAMQSVNTQMRGLNRTEQSQLAALRETSKQRALTSSELKTANLILTERQAGLSMLIQTQKDEVASLTASGKATKLDKDQKEALKKTIENVNTRLAINEKLLASTTSQQQIFAAAQVTTGAKVATAAKIITTGMGNLAVGTLNAGRSLLGLTTGFLGFISIAALVGSTIAGLLGKQEAYNALLQKGAAALSAFFNPRSVQGLDQAYLDLSANALEELSKVDSKLKETDSYKIKDKVFGISVNIEKTKEDLVKGVAAAVQEAEKVGEEAGIGESWGATWGSAILGGLGAIVGAGIGSVLGPLGIGIGYKTGTLIGVAMGAAIGAYLDPATKQAVDITEDRLNEIAAMLGNADLFNSSETNDKLKNTVAILDEQYGAMAKLSLVGRQFYIDSLNTAVALVDATNNMELFTTAANNTGIQVSAIKDRFVELSNTSVNLQITPVLSNIGDVQLPDVVITIQDEQKLIEDLTKIQDKVETLQNAISTRNPRFEALEAFAQSVDNIVNGIADLAISTQTVNNDLLIANNNLQTFANSIDDGSITLEKFAESESSIAKTLQRSSQELDLAKNKLKELNAERDKAGKSQEADPKVLADLDAQINAQQKLIKEGEAALPATRERLRTVVAQGQVLKDILKDEEALNALFDAELKTKLELLAVDEATGAIAATAFEKDMARAKLLANQLNENRAFNEQRLEFEAQINDVLQASGKAQIGLQTELFALSGENAQERLKQIAIENSFSTEQRDRQSDIVALTGKAAKGSELYTNALKAANVSAIQIYESLRAGSADFQKQIKQIDRDLKELVVENRIVKLNLEVESLNLDYQIVQDQLDAQIASLESQISIVEALTDLDNFATVDSIVKEVNAALADTSIKVEVPKELQNLSAVEAAKTVTQKQFEILKLQVAAENKRYLNELQNIAIQEDILKAEYALEVTRREAEKTARIAEVTLQKNNLTALATTYSDVLTSQRDINQYLVDALADVFSQAAQRIATAMGSEVMPGGISAQTIGGEVDIAANLKASLETFGADAAVLIDKIGETARAEATAAAEAQSIALENIDKQKKASGAAHEAKMGEIANEALLTGIAGKKALKDIAEEAAKGSGERAKALEEMQKLLNEAGEKVKELAKQLAQQVIEALQGAVTTVMQKKIDLLAAQEAMISDTLSYVAVKTEDASSKLQQTLEKENSLREEVAAKTEALTKSYEDFITSLGDANGKVKESSKEYITKLLDQKRSIIELNKTGIARIAQEGVVKTLEEQKIALEEKLKEVTEKRIEAEEKLQKIQEAFGLLSDMLSGKFMQMAQTIMQLAQAVAAFNAMAGMGAGAGIGFQPIINQFSSAVAQFNKAAQTAGMATQATANAGTNIAAASNNMMVAFSPKLLAGMQMFGAALNGFSIGSIVGQLTGDMGMGSSIGGLVGGIATAIPAVTTAITGAITGALGSGFFATALTAAIPVIGPILGALVGGLFSKKPKGQAQGTLTSEGFETTSMSGRKVDPKALASIADVALTGVVGSLKAAGISFTDTVNTSISYYKKGINGATLEFANGFKASFKGGSAQEAGDFFVKSFFQGLRLGSLSVDETLPAANRLQAAIDNFVTLGNVSEKTAERFQKSIDFASKFDDALVELNGTGTNVAQVFSIIEKAALANAANVSRYYSQFLSETKETFGASSSEYREAYEAAQNNALAQIGLAKDLAGNIVTAEEAMRDLNTGAVLIKDTIANIEAFRSVLTELDIADVDTQISKAINAKLGSMVSDISESLTTSIDKLKDPASAAAYELRGIMEAGVERIEQLQGMYDELQTFVNDGYDIAGSVLSDAASNIAKATELAKLQVEAYINSLDKSGLRAIITNNAWGDAAALAAAQTRLATVLEYERVQAIEKFVDISRSFKKRLAEISGQMVKTADVPISFTATTEVMKAFEQDVSTSLTNTFTGLLNSIGRGDSIVSNFEDGITLLNNSLASGELDSLAYANGLEMLQEVSLTVLEEIKSMVDEYESLVEQISDSFKNAKDTVISAIQELGEQVISLTQNISDKTSEILGIYDDTLASVAESGNELFDLRDTAKEAFSTAARAVSEFEKSNKLSGRSSAALRNEIVSIQSQLDQLLSSGSLDFAGFAQFTELSSKQSALKKELSSVVSVEAEYEKLLADRATTQEDLAFVEATLATLSNELIDTRVKESDIVRKAKESSENFVKSQQDLRKITELLAESNFNLNQARFDEESAVSKMRLALSEFNKDTEALTGILEAVGGEAGAELKSAFIEAAVGNAEILYAELGEVAKNIKIAEAAQQAASAFAQLEVLVSQVGSYFEPVDDIFMDLESVSLTSLALTDRFKQFNDDLVKYLDQDGLAQFYGANGVFSTFREALLTTLKTDGFDVLTASGGPLESFNLNLMTIRTAIDTLTQSGNFLDISIQSVETSFGNLISAVGADINGLTSAFVGLSVVNQTISDIETAALTLLLNDVGRIKVALDDVGNLNINVQAFEALDDLYASILVVDSALGNIDFKLSSENAVNSITTAIDIVNSSIDNLSVETATNWVVDQINNIVTTVNSTLSGVSFQSNIDGVTDKIVNVINALNSSLSQIDFGNSTSSAITEITTNINAINSTLSDISLVEATDSTVEKINVTFNTINSTLENIDLVTVTDSTVDKINVTFNAIDSALTNIDFVTARDSSVDQINLVNANLNSSLQNVSFVTTRESTVNQINLVNDNVNSALQNVSFVTTRNSAVNEINAVNTNINSRLTAINFVTTRDSAVNQINAVNTNINSSLTNVNFVATSGNAVNQINAVNTNINSRLNAVNFVTARDGAVNQINVVNTNINSALSNINLSSNLNSAVGQINVVGVNLNSALDKVNFVVTTNAVVDKIAAYNIAVNSALSNVDLVDNTDSLVDRINSVSILVNTALSDVDFEETTSTVVKMINDYNTSVNDALGNVELKTETANVVAEVMSLVGIENALDSIALSSKANSARIQINAIQTDLNKALGDINLSTVLSNANSQINGIQTDLLGKLDGIELGVKLGEAKTQLQNVQTDINQKLDDISFGTSVSSLVSRIGNVATSINGALDASTLDKVKQTFDALLGVFDNDASTAVGKFKTAIDGFKDLTAQINSVSGLAAQISALSNPSTGATAALISRFSALQTEIQTLTGTTGVAALKNQLASITTDLGAAWSKVNLQVSQLPTKITVANTNEITVQEGFKAADSANLNRLATTFPAIQGATYKRAPYAKGGYVDGKGTSTSDSIPANLSNGEFVIKAASVDKLGIDALNYLNQTGDIISLVAGMGRRGDTEIAHINTDEKRMLQKLRNEVITANPKTGFAEFFPLWSGAVGKMFAKEEKALLGKTYIPKILDYNERSNYKGWGSSDQQYNRPEKRTFTASNTATPWTSPTYSEGAMTGQGAGYTGTEPYTNTIAFNDLFAAAYRTKLKDSQQAMFNMMNEMLVARRSGEAIKKLEWLYAPDKEDDNKRWASTYLLNKSTTDNSSVQTGYGMFRRFKWGGFNSGNKNFGPYGGGWEQKSAAALQQNTKDYFGKDLSVPAAAAGASQFVTQSMIDQAVDLANENYGNFGDLYMLGDTGKGRPTAANLVTGGLITKSMNKLKGLRDSVSAMLEPGEFVLRKPIVEKVGVDTLNKVNAGSGNFAGDTNVEVNITNNGTPVNVTATPQVRRENEKIVIDVILEDIRTNGPIRQQIRSIR